MNINHRGQGLGYSALDKACLFGHEKIVSLLLNSTLHGPSIDYFGNEADWSPLSLATRSGNVNIMKLLLPLMEPEQIDEKFGTKQENILMEACRMGTVGDFFLTPPPKKKKNRGADRHGDVFYCISASFYPFLTLVPYFFGEFFELFKNEKNFKF